MSGRDSNREYRRKRRIRSQIISYSVMAVVLIAVIAGCAVGIRAAAGMIREKREAKEASIQAAEESARAEESAQAQSAVEELLGMESTEAETAVEYTPEDALNEMVEESVAGMTLEQKVAGLFFVTPEQLTGVGQAVQAGEGTQEALATWPVGGLVYFKQNIQSEEQLREMLANTASYSTFPIFLGVDEEGGRVARVADALGLENVGPMADIGSTGDVQAAYTANQTIGTYLASYGFNVDFAPVADVLTNEDNAVIGDRAFSGDPQTVADMVAGAVEGLQSAGVSACLKHFPGHGDTAGDSHTGAAETDRTKEEMDAAEFLPFRSGIETGADMVMVGHISAPSLTDGEKIPASLSEEIITGILREELGYDGIVITDAMNMAAVTDYYEADVAAIMALKAGADMILMPEDFQQAYEGVLQAVQDGTISQERVDDSLKRIYRVKLRDKIS
ncbi:MAG: beta-N-acetylhexosaminidase [Clostridiales bacterium]|nr:MAG: beta-N-acetylhexosaminidase [Clostridiales bacterium]HJA32188.1 glycoside hydrolase family 3 protein [Candidatus Eisenbergiella pullicola]